MRIAVTGAAGQLGGQVVRLLEAVGDHDLVPLTRRNADYDDPAALRAALRGVDTLVFVSSDGETARLLVHHDNVIRAALDAKVSHVVALSSVDADPRSPFCYAVTNGVTERLLRESGIPYSFARASIYTEFFLHWITEARTSGELRVPAGAGRISLVSRDDVGRCMAALAAATPTGGHHDITGPDALDLPTIAATVAETFRTPIRYVDLVPAEHHLEMARGGMDPWWAYAFSSMFASIREDRWASVSGAVTELTDQPPVTLHHVLRDLQASDLIEP
jgi:NAD(P)H dehydrogenase (quinone)